MNNKRYILISEPGLKRFTFQSIGVKGEVVKAIEYTPVEVLV